MARSDGSRSNVTIVSKKVRTLSTFGVWFRTVLRDAGFPPIPASKGLPVFRRSVLAVLCGLALLVGSLALAAPAQARAPLPTEVDELLPATDDRVVLDEPTEPVVDPAPVEPTPVDPAPVDPAPELLGDLPPDVPLPCTGLTLTPLLVVVDPTGATFDVTLSDVCFATTTPEPGTTRHQVTARLVGPRIDVAVAGEVTFDGTGLVDLDLRGWGTYEADNFGVEGVIRLHGVTGAATIEVSGALRSAGAVITGDVVGTLHKTAPDGYSLDLAGRITYQRGALEVTGDVVTYLEGRTPAPNDLPTDVDPATLWGNLRLRGTARLGGTSGNVDVVMSRAAGSDPVFLQLVITQAQLVKGVTLDRLALGNSAAMPAVLTIDAQLTVPKILFEQMVLQGVGTIDTTTGAFDLALHDDHASTPWLGLFWRWGQSADIRLVGTASEVRLRGQFTIGAISPALGSAAGGVGTLEAVLDRNTGAISGSIDVVAAGCVIFCVLASVNGAVHIDVSGNLADGWVDVSGGGSANGSVLFGAVASGSGSARVDAHLDFSGPRLVMSGTAQYAVSVSTWLGMTRNVDDWMDLRLDNDRITIVDGQWRRKREKVVDLRGEVFPVMRQCGNRYTKHWIDLDGWDYEGRWGDCDGNGGVAVGTVSGRLLTDADRDGTASAGDTPVADQDLVIRNGGGTVVGVGYTDADGSYSVRVTPGSGLRLELDPMPSDRYQGYHWPSGLSVASGGHADAGTSGLSIISFGAASGTAFHDVDDDGEHDADEPVFPSLTVTVTRTGSDPGTPRQVVTDDTGRWAVGGLDQRYSYEARYSAPAGYWVRDDPFRLDEDVTWFGVYGTAPSEVGEVAVVNSHVVPAGSVVSGYVQAAPQTCDPYGSGGGYGYPYPCDPYGGGGYPYQTIDGSVEGAIVRLDTGHVVRTDWSGSFRFEGVAPGTHSYWVEHDSGYAYGTVEVLAGQDVTFHAQLAR